MRESSGVTQGNRTAPTASPNQSRSRTPLPGSRLRPPRGAHGGRESGAAQAQSVAAVLEREARAGPRCVHSPAGPAATAAPLGSARGGPSEDD